MDERTKAALVLALLSPMIAELLSGSSPPLEFFTPFSFALLLGMYGAGALLVREAVVLWRKGWASTLLLGAAYGVVEEGIAVKSFFDPGWVDLGPLGEYGRYMDVNWVWAVWLTIYHTVMSIALPIMILGILYPATKGERLLTRRGLRFVAAVFAVDIAACVFLFAEIQEYMPPAPQYVACFLVAGALVVAAWRARPDLVRASGPAPTWSPRRFTVLGLCFLGGSFVISGSAVDSVPPVAVIGALLALSLVSLKLIERNIGASGNTVHLAHLAVGLMLFLIVLGPVNELANGIPGMTAVAVAFAVFSFYLVRRARASENQSQVPG